VLPAQGLCTSFPSFPESFQVFSHVPKHLFKEAPYPVTLSHLLFLHKKKTIKPDFRHISMFIYFLPQMVSSGFMVLFPRGHQASVSLFLSLSSSSDPQTLLKTLTQ
jgi:hypothetical protein